MTFKAPHVSLVSFAVEVHPWGIIQVIILETDLHLNPRHSSYNRHAVEFLISAAQNYIRGNIEGVACVRLVSTRTA
jgi:hypothetical protein